jgi:hypothetical protein
MNFMRKIPKDAEASNILVPISWIFYSTKKIADKSIYEGQNVS